MLESEPVVAPAQSADPEMSNDGSLHMIRSCRLIIRTDHQSAWRETGPL